MHEWALAESVVATIEEELARHTGSRLQGVTVEFGELQNIDREIFTTGLTNIMTSIPDIDTRVTIETRPARFRCNACGREWGLDGADGLTDEQRESIHFLPESVQAFMSCPSCGGVDFRVVDGRGVSVRSIELIEAEGEAPA